MQQAKRINLAVIMIVAILSIWACGCGRLQRIDLVEPETQVAQRNVVIFFVDGISHEVYHNMLQDGELPGIKKYLVDRGVSVQNGVTSIPSITYAITTSIGTGLVPAHHGILGNKYFDRDRLVMTNYNTIGTYRDLDQDFLAQTFYEMLYDKYSITLQTPLRRGVYHNIDNWMSSGIRWFFRQYGEVDALVAERFEKIQKMAQQTGRWPELIFAYMPGVDENGHQYGPYSQEYRAALRNADEQIGRICAALEHSGLLETTYLVLITDHGMADIPPNNHLKPCQTIARKFDLKLTDHGPDDSTVFHKRQAYFDQFNAVVVNGSYRRLAVFLRNGEDWAQPGPTELAQAIADDLSQWPQIALVARPDGDAVLVSNHSGAALIEREAAATEATLNQKRYRYRVVDGTDPLGYTTHSRAVALMDGNYHDGRSWLLATAETRFPDLLVQIAEHFDSKRAGDLVAFADDEWDFAPELCGGHGSVTATDMRVPMVFAGPGITAGASIPVARVVDIAPTIVEMASPGRSRDYQFDGESLLLQLMGTSVGQ